MPQASRTELIGGNSGPVNLGTGDAHSTVALDKAVQDKVRASFTAKAAFADKTEPDRVFLNLQNIRGKNDAAAFSVYVDLPPGADPQQNPDHLAGTVSLFGVRKASQTDGPHAGNGLNESLEITKIIDRLHLSDKLDTQQLQIKIVPVSDIQPQDQISIGTISVYRQGK